MSNDIEDLIFEAALDESQWSEAVRRISEVFGHRPTILFGRDVLSGQKTVGAVSNVHPDAWSKFQNKYLDVEKNPFLADEYSIGVPLHLPMDFAGQMGRKEFRRLEIYEDLYLPYKTEERMAIVCNQMNREFWGLTVKYFENEDPEPWHAAKLAEISRIFERAGRLSARVRDLQARNRQLSAVLDAAPYAAALVGPDGQVLWRNAVCDALFHASALIACRRGYLRARIPAHSGLVDKLIASAFSTGAERHLRLASDEEVLVLCARPVPRPLALPSGPAVMIELRTPAAGIEVKPETIAAALALTPAEARVVSALCAQPDLSRIAATQKVSLATVKTLLQRAFAKTNTHSQAELVLLAATSVAQRVE
jgi:DNA-binding CsgD family transcriptional regulator